MKQRVLHARHSLTLLLYPSTSRTLSAPEQKRAMADLGDAHKTTVGMTGKRALGGPKCYCDSSQSHSASSIIHTADGRYTLRRRLTDVVNYTIQTDRQTNKQNFNS